MLKEKLHSKNCEPGNKNVVTAALYTNQSTLIWIDSNFFFSNSPCMCRRLAVSMKQKFYSNKIVSLSIENQFRADLFLLWFPIETFPSLPHFFHTFDRILFFEWFFYLLNFSVRLKIVFVKPSLCGCKKSDRQCIFGGPKTWLWKLFNLFKCAFFFILFVYVLYVRYGLIESNDFFSSNFWLYFIDASITE